MSRAKPYHSNIQNKDYTIRELAEITGKTISTMRINLLRGWTVDEILGLVDRVNPHSKPRHSEIENRDYTVKELSEITGKTQLAIRTNLYDGWTVDEILGLVKHINPRFKPHHSNIQNKDYTSRELEEITGKKVCTIRANLRNGWTVDEILGLVEHTDSRTKPHHSDIQNKDYTVKELSEITGKAYSSIQSNLDNGWTVDEVLGLVPHLSKYDGHDFVYNYINIGDIKILKKAYSSFGMDYYECIDTVNNDTFIKSREELYKLWNNKI